MSAARHGASTAPSTWVERWLKGVPVGATALDLACGRGRHTHAALARGLRVTSVERDAAALDAVSDQAERLALDLEAAQWPLAGYCFDVVIVTNYLYRPHFDALLACVAPAGLLIYETFAAGHAHYGKPSNPDFLLAPRELLARLDDDWHVLAYEDGVRADPSLARVQRVAALRSDVRLLERHAL